MCDFDSSVVLSLVKSIPPTEEDTDDEESVSSLRARDGELDVT